MRLLISGGGTGGHLSPALAVAQAFRAARPEAELLLVGRVGGLEERLVPAHGLALETVRIRGFDRDAPLRNLALPVVLPRALAHGLRIVDRWRPDVVLGVGGYVMAPAVAAARIRRVPYVLQVSEARGLANRMFRGGAAAACVTFPGDVESFRTRGTVLTGYPLRPGFERRAPEVPPRRLLVMGGSQGARRLNKAVWGALDGLLDRFEEVVHLTGDQGAAEAAGLARPGYRPIAFSDQMPGLLAEADLVLSRSGVGTCAELTAVGLPAVVVPGTFGGGHQARNAAELVRAGAAVQVADAALTPDVLLATLETLTSDRLRAMAAASASLGRPDAARAIVRVLEEIAEAFPGGREKRGEGERGEGERGMTMRVHMMPMGGAGVSALARVFLARGDDVSGCDLAESTTTRQLAAEGADVAIGHATAHVEGQDLLVYGGGVRGTALEEVAAARAAGVRVVTRAELLAELLAEGDGVAVAGTHGKTTVTYMAGHALTAAGYDPTVLVGDGASSRVGRSRWLVAEADESDGSLALHRPRHGVLTSVEFDHPDHFAGIDQVDALFRGFLARIPGVSVVCADYPRAAAMPAGGRRVTYGFSDAADYRCVEAGGGRFDVERRGERLAVGVRLAVPGAHNRQNATAVFALAVELGVEPAVVADALATFPGAHRRLERLGTWRGASVYDDYGHHPTKVRVTLAAARELGHRRVILVFQPHRYSRYQALRDEFAESLRGADAVVVTEIYPAGEPDPGGVSAVELAMRVPRARFAPDLDSARDHLEELVGEGDLLLLMGAGDIWRLAHELAHAG